MAVECWSYCLTLPGLGVRVDALHVLGLPLCCNQLDGLYKIDATKHMPRKIGDRSRIQKHLFMILSVQQNYNKSFNKNLKSLSQAQLL